MGDNSKIEWTDATWNPITGCSVVSPGCTNCYAMRLAGTRLQHHPSRAGLTRPSKAGPVWTGTVRLNEQWLDQPLRWKRPRRIFVCAHADLFHEAIPDVWIYQVLAVMALAPWHIFQVLTKRSARMRELLSQPSMGETIWIYADRTACDAQLPESHPADPYLRAGSSAAPWPLPNVHLYVSCEDQPRADERIPDLLATPAAVRGVSLEPLLGSIDLSAVPAVGRSGWLEPLTGNHKLQPIHADHRGARLDHVIVGGESGPGFRMTPVSAFYSLRDQCAAAGVPFFMKQMPGKLPIPADLMIRQYPKES